MKKNSAAPAIASKEIKNLESINLDQFADQLDSLALKEKRERETIYKYPEGFQKSDIGSEKGKKLRNKLRNRMKTLSNNILLFAKMKRMDDLKSEIAQFDAFYSENYRINDYSLASISQSNDPEKEKDFDLLMRILREFKKN